MAVIRQYYFDQENGQISEGYTTITITNHVAEISSDDPDAVFVANKHGGLWQFKHEERFRKPPLEIEPPPSDMNILGLLQWLSNSNMGEAACQIVIPLAIDDLTPVIRDSLQYLYLNRLLFFEEDYKPGQMIFSLSCPRWGYLGTLKLTKRGDVTYLILSNVPSPIGDELSTAKMLNDSGLFQYGKQKYRGNAMRLLFDSLSQDPIWLFVSNGEGATQGVSKQRYVFNANETDVRQFIEEYAKRTTFRSNIGGERTNYWFRFKFGLGDGTYKILFDRVYTFPDYGFDKKIGLDFAGIVAQIELVQEEIGKCEAYFYIETNPKYWELKGVNGQLEEISRMQGLLSGFLTSFWQGLKEFWHSKQAQPPESPVSISDSTASSSYDLGKVRTLLFDVFSEDDLRDYCQQERFFSPVYKELKDIDRPREIIRRMLDYADRKGLVRELLDWAKGVNPTRYAEGEPYETN